MTSPRRQRFLRFDLVEVSGTPARTGAMLRVHYTGWPTIRIVRQQREAIRLVGRRRAVHLQARRRAGDPRMGSRIRRHEGRRQTSPDSAARFGIRSLWHAGRIDPG